MSTPTTESQSTTALIHAAADKAREALHRLRGLEWSAGLAGKTDSPEVDAVGHEVTDAIAELEQLAHGVHQAHESREIEASLAREDARARARLGVVR